MRSRQKSLLEAALGQDSIIQRQVPQLRTALKHCAEIERVLIGNIALANEEEVFIHGALDRQIPQFAHFFDDSVKYWCSDLCDDCD